jgi:hypothetical protein
MQALFFLPFLFILFYLAILALVFYVIYKWVTKFIALKEEHNHLLGEILKKMDNK